MQFGFVALPPEPGRVDAVHEQGLGAVDVAHPAQHRLVEQQRADGLLAAQDAIDRHGRACVAPQGVGAQTGDDGGAVGFVADGAIGGASEVDGAVVGLQSHPHGAPRFRCLGPTMYTELAEQAEVHMADQPVRPVVPEVLAEGFQPVEGLAIDHHGIGEATLGRGHGNGSAGEQCAVVLGDAVDGVALGHGGAG